MSNAIENADRLQPAMVGFKQCGCAVAVDLDACGAIYADWQCRHYEIRIMPKADAVALLNSSFCLHK